MAQKLHGVRTWRLLKSVRRSNTVSNYNLLHKTVFDSQIVYGHPNRHVAVGFRQNNIELVGIIDGILAYNSPEIPSHLRMVLIRLLRIVEPHIDNTAVVNVFGQMRYAYQLSS